MGEPGFGNRVAGSDRSSAAAHLCAHAIVKTAHTRP